MVDLTIESNALPKASIKAMTDDINAELGKSQYGCMDYIREKATRIIRLSKIMEENQENEGEYQISRSRTDAGTNGR